MAVAPTPRHALSNPQQATNTIAVQRRTLADRHAPFNRSALLSPAVTIGALVTFLLLSGVAVAALGALLTALIALYLLVVQVFGVSIEFNPFGAVR